MAKVYLTSASRDRDIAAAIAETLKGFGLEVSARFDFRHGGFAEARNTKRREAAIVVALLSDAALRSSEARRDATAALEADRLIGLVPAGMTADVLPAPFDRVGAIEWGAAGAETALAAALRARGVPLPLQPFEIAPPLAPSAAPQRRARASRLPEDAGPEAADIPDFLRPPAPPPPGRPSAPAEAPAAPTPLETLAAPAEGKVGPVDVFVCYSRHDADACRLLVEELALQNLKPFVDQFLEAGDEWRAVIAASIRKAPVIVVLLSERSTASAEVRREINFALDLQKPVIPVVIDAAPLPDAFKLALAKDNYVHAGGDLALAIRKASNKAKEIVAVRAFDERHLRETFGFSDAPTPTVSPTPMPLEAAANVSRPAATSGARGPAIVLGLALSAGGCAALYRLAETRGALAGVEPTLAIALLAAFVGAPYALALTLLIRAALRR